MTSIGDRRDATAHVFVSPDALIGDGMLTPDDDVRHHLARVLRLRDGEVVSVSDGVGGWRLTTVRRSGDHIALEPTSDVVCDDRPSVPLTIATAMPKGDRLDWLVQKTTELGVDRLQLFETERSVVRWRPDRIDKQLTRLQRISDEAARQSRRTHLVEVLAPIDVSIVLPRCAVAEPGGRPLGPDDRFVAVGPEGGWTAAELAMANDAVTIGDNVLRTETAAVAIAALCVVRNH